MPPLSAPPYRESVAGNWRHCLERGGSVVTVNQRLARLLRNRFDAYQLGRGESIWPSPDILPWPVWLQRCWTTCAEQSNEPFPALLGPEQVLALWSSIVSRAAPGLLRVEEAAQNAAAAWHNLHQWEVEPAVLSGAAGDDVRVFLTWAHDYERLTERHGWIDSARVSRRLGELAVAGDAVCWKRPVCFAGFDDPPPALRRLIRNMREGGLEVSIDACAPSTPPGTGAVGAQRFADPAAELAAAARWARAHIEGEGAGGGRALSIGIVIPDLARRRSAVKRQLTEVLAAPACRIEPASAPPGFEISLGPPLGQMPVARAAMSVLRLVYSGVALAEAGNVLHSPYLGTAKVELGARTRLEEVLRARGEHRLWAGDMTFGRRAAGDESEPSPSAEMLEGFFARLSREAATEPASQSLRAFTSAFARCLEHAGWPGHRGLDSEEFQAMETFRETLAGLPRLAVLNEPLEGRAAVGILGAALSRQIFQPQSSAGSASRERAAPILVTGILETTGQPFDALWVCSLDDRNWPVAPSPNPFIPPALQRRLGMPRADADREREVAVNWTRRLASAAPEVVFSYAEEVDGEARSLSALIVPFLGKTGNGGEATLAVRPWLHPWQWIRTQAPPLAASWDKCGPPLRPGELGRGGARVFADQAQCPFRAFAVHRLASIGVSAPAVPLDARSRGLLLHRALDRFWARLSGRQRLAELSSAQRRRRIGQAVDAAIHAAVTEGALARRPPLADLERARLERVLDQWLDLELQRADFEVLDVEGTQSCEVGGVPVTLRPDRVDRLADGSLFVLDYKSSPHGIAEWFGARPEDPQLPVYALALREAGEVLGGLGFGILTRDGVTLRGLGREVGVGPGLRTVDKPGRKLEATSWAAMFDNWSETIGALGRSFADGEAAVDPKAGIATCRYCEQQPLCRYSALQPSEEQLAEDGA